MVGFMCLCKNPLKPDKALPPGRVPHVLPSVHGPDTIFFECFYSVCDDLIGGMRAFGRAPPDFLCSVSASVYFMRLSLMKAAHAVLSSAP